MVITEEQAQEMWVEENPEYVTCKDEVIKAIDESRHIDYCESKGLKIIEVGDLVRHWKFGECAVERLDSSTYSTPFLIVRLETGETIARPLAEFTTKEDGGDY